ncbi:MAG: tRNA pseudouridine(55) synthase TruB [Spirochaetaceae bacterium]|jgi:tRNA pseudouridine55 synthase|nr:tRNA pseudouridine(55) synthase TruB [Spirochaetaceae bacterium]
MEYLLYNKPCGVTSFDALYPIKKALKTSKVGHTGTLDKFACGLLIILKGRALKLSRFFTHCDKKYEAEVYFGAETDTLDPEGVIIARAPPPSREDLEKAIKQHCGKIMQKPPAYSAIHINGKRAHSLARSGLAQEMVIPARAVTIHDIKLISYDKIQTETVEQGKVAKIFVHCSSGTYIRSLMRDIAIESDSRSHLKALRRIAVADFNVAEAADCATPADFISAFTPIDRACFSRLGIPLLDVDATTAKSLSNGRALNALFAENFFPPSRDVATLFYGQKLIAVLEKEKNCWKYGFVNNDC